MSAANVCRASVHKLALVGRLASIRSFSDIKIQGSKDD